MKTIPQLEINYVEYLCEVLPNLLQDINREIKENDYFLYSSDKRAKFDRIRIELNKTLMDIKRIIY